MAVRKKLKRKKRRSGNNKSAAPSVRFVLVSNKSYGNALKGTRIYFEGERPKGLRDDGSIQFGKNMLEALRRKFSAKFRWILTENTDSIEEKGGIFEVRTSMAMLNRMYAERFERDRDVKNDIVQRRLFAAFPSHFVDPPPAPYLPGSLSKILSPGVAKKMSSKDKESLNAFLPEYGEG